MPENPLDVIFAASEDQSRKRLQDKNREYAEKGEKERKLRRLLRVVTLVGGGIALLTGGIGTYVESPVLMGSCLVSVMFAGPAFVMLLLKGGVAKPRYKDSFNKSARKRLRD